MRNFLNGTLGALAVVAAGSFGFDLVESFRGHAVNTLSLRMALILAVLTSVGVALDYLLKMLRGEEDSE